MRIQLQSDFFIITSHRSHIGNAGYEHYSSKWFCANCSRYFPNHSTRRGGSASASGATSWRTHMINSTVRVVVTVVRITIRWTSPTVIHWLHPETQVILLFGKRREIAWDIAQKGCLCDGHMFGGLRSGILGMAILVLTHSLSFNWREILIAIINITLFSTVGAGINVILQPLQFTVLSPTPPPCSPCVITLPPT